MKAHGSKIGVGAVILFLLLVPMAQAVSFPFVDDFEGGLGNWVTNGIWGITSMDSHSPTRSITDSPATFYTDNTDSDIALASSIDLSGATLPAISFYQHRQIEEGYDFGFVEISTNGGASYLSPPLVSYTGNQADWAREQVDLDVYAGASDVRIRFRLETDASIVMDGWYIDDVSIGEKPAAVTLSVSTAVVNRIDLEWTPSVDPDFEVYRVYRSLTSNVNWQTARLLTEVSDSGTTNYSDIHVSQKTRYFYRVMVLKSNALHALSNEVDPLTPVGCDFPFLDDAEGGSALWIADTPWAISGEASVSPTNAYSDSPGTNYAPSVNPSLTLAAPLDLSGTTQPILEYSHEFTMAAGDSCNVEISTNDGVSWVSLASHAGDSAGWLRGRHDLSSYQASAIARVRFRLTSDPGTVADGWHVDDIAIAEAPVGINPPVLDQVQAHSLRLTWAASSDPFFSHYAIYRSTSTGVGIQSTLAATISDISTITHTDTGLALDTDYYYRIYAINTYGVHSSDSALESTERTLPHRTPYSEDFEAGLLGWNISGSWTTTIEHAHSGSFSLTESPGTVYSNSISSSWAQTSVDLTGSEWPVLTFWDRYDITDTAGDYAWVEISPNGSTWYRRYTCVGTRTNWAEQTIDLSEWKDEDDLRIRFWFQSDSSVSSDGWHIDDVSISEHTPVGLAYPYREDFEQGVSNWLSAGWEINTNEIYGGTASVLGNPFPTLPYATHLSMTLSGGLDLSAAFSPQLTYWAQGSLQYKSYFQIQASSDGGKTWGSLDGLSYTWSTNNWMRRQVAIPVGYIGTNTHFRAAIWGNGSYNPVAYIILDNLVIEDQPDGVIMDPLVPHLKSIDLSWAVSELDANFQRYEIYCSPDATVNWDDELIGSFTDTNDTSMTDSNLSIGATYYYGIYVVNTNDTYSSISTRSATTVPLSMEVIDPMEDLDNWDVVGDWGVDSSQQHGGSASISDSPGVDYENSLNPNYIMTAVDLSSATWPVLSFWDRYDITDTVGDYAWVEISANGSTWYRRYTCMGTRTNWAEQTIDLSEWKGESNVRIRFWLQTDSSVTSDGWYIDDVSITEHTPVGLAYPYREDFEQGVSNWLSAGWEINTNEIYGGTASGLGNPFPTLPYATHLSMTLSGGLDLSAASSPQLTYWAQGSLQYKSYFQIQASSDGGKTWGSLDGLSYTWSTNNWMRRQVAIPVGYIGTNTHFRAAIWGNGSYNPVAYIILDNLVIEDQPDGVVLNSLVPHLKSIDLSWAVSELGSDFQRYEIYRSPDATVNWDDELIGSFTDTNDTSMTDSNLSIGATYYYGIYVVNTNDTYSSISTRSATTVPLSMEVIDPMEDLDNWDVVGDWGVDSSQQHGGSASISDSPGVDYENSLNPNYIMTAVDLSSATWPVLKFWDRYDITDTVGDYAWVEISANGSTWYRRYTCMGTRTNWAEQTINLSEWKGESNVRIRFWFQTDSSVTSDGWYIDDVSITEHTPVGLAYPYREDFEHGTSNWLSAGWEINTNAPYADTSSVLGNQAPTLPYGAHLSMTLAGALDLSAASSPQLTYWAQGSLQYKSYFQIQASSDGGKTWGSLDGLSYTWSTNNWMRRQVAIPVGYIGTNTHFRAAIWGNGSYNPVAYITLDNLVIEDQPDGVILNATPHLKSIDLSWTVSDLGSDFQRYEIYRSADATVTWDDERIGSFSGTNDTSMTDSGLSIGATYYYGIYVVNTNDTYSAVNTRDVTTVPLALGFSDPMENLDNWYVQGDWGVDTIYEHGGSASISDSPGGAYQNSLGNNYILTSVDLSSADWPVLKFWDRHDIPDLSGDYAWVEISANGSSWTRRYNVLGTRTNWVEQTIDLSDWKGQPNIRIRFWLQTDSSVTGDGWYIDDLSVTDLGTPAMPYPFFEDFETDMTNWLAASWALSMDDPYAGNQAALSSEGPTLPYGTDLHLLPAGAFDLSGSVEPQLTWFIKGNLPYQSWYRMQVSVNGGVNWTDLDSQSYTWSSGWIKKQVDMSAYRTNNVRLRARVWPSTSYNIAAEIAIDNFGLGEPAPGVPTLVSPLNLESMPMVRPTLVVQNAIDTQSDTLTYAFEVYSDAGLTNLVANVPVIASGVTQTQWTVDTDLTDGGQYWWRAQAHDGTTNGSWMATATFYVNQVNQGPVRVEVEGPPPASILHDATYSLTWYPTTDPDPGDTVDFYHVQVDDDDLFGSPVINDSNLTVTGTASGGVWTIAMPLEDMAGHLSLVDAEQYHWRVRAIDNWGGVSLWSTNIEWFIYGIPPPTMRVFDPDGTGKFIAQWERTGKGVQLEFTPSLTEQDWQPLGDVNYGTNLMITPESGSRLGFYRTITLE